MGEGLKTSRSVRGSAAWALTCVLATVFASGCDVSSQKSFPANSSAFISAKPGPFVPGNHGPFPQVLKGAGTVMTNPKFLLLSFNSDAKAPGLANFLTKFAAGNFWFDMVGEYGVGAATVPTAVDTAAILGSSMADTGVQAIISSLFGGPLGAADDSTIYILKFPSSVTITGPVSAGGGTSCVDFGGYHFRYNDPGSGKLIIYAVIPECSGESINNITAAITHELVEAATDPDAVSAKTGFTGVSDDFAVWEALFGPELGDMCEGFSDSFFTPHSLPNAIQKTWSNAAALGSGDPCVPSLNETYFNAIPVLSDSVKLTAFGSTVVTKGILIPPGGSRTVELDLYSNVATAPWTVSLVEVVSDSTSHVNAKLDLPNGANLARIHATITVNSQDPSWKANVIMVQSTMNGITKEFPFVIGTP